MTDHCMLHGVCRPALAESEPVPPERRDPHTAPASQRPQLAPYAPVWPVKCARGPETCGRTCSPSRGSRPAAPRRMHPSRDRTHAARGGPRARIRPNHGMASLPGPAAAARGPVQPSVGAARADGALVVQSRLAPAGGGWPPLGPPSGPGACARRSFNRVITTAIDQQQPRPWRYLSLY